MDEVDWTINPPKIEIRNAWPPRHNPPMTFINFMKRIECFIRRSKLVWLRGIDDTVVLAVAYTEFDGRRYAYRWWPDGVKVYLNEDGTVEQVSAKKDEVYVRHWIAEDETNKIYMWLQNSEVYLEPLED
jgi:hypothetical protein